MKYKDYLKYYEGVQTLEELISKKLILGSVLIDKKDFEIIQVLKNFSIIKIGDFKYMVYTIKKQLYTKYEDFKIDSCSVFRLLKNIYE